MHCYWDAELPPLVSCALHWVPASRHLTDVDEGSLALATTNAKLNGLDALCTVQELDVMNLTHTPCLMEKRLTRFLHLIFPMTLSMQTTC